METANESGTRTLRFKIGKSACLVITWICMGLYSGIISPTLPDLAERLNTDYDKLGLSIAFRSIGKMFGSVTLGYLRDRFGNKGDLLLGIALISVALSVATKPWAATVAVLTFLYFAEGFLHGGINAVGNSMCVLMWKEKAALPVHVLHFGYGVGALIVPLIARPYLSEYVTMNVTAEGRPTSQLKTLMNTSNNYTLKVMQKDVSIKTSQIEIPYGIVSGFVCFVGLVYVWLYCYMPFRKLTAVLGRRSYSNPCKAPFLQDRPRSAIAIMGLFFLYYMMNSMIDKSLGSFLFTYAVEGEVGFTKNEAAYLNTAFFACYAGGRVVMAFVAAKVPVKFILFSEVFFMATCSGVITFFAYNKRLFLWVFSCSMAFFFGPIFPSGVAWVDRYIPLYGLVMSVFDVGNGIGAFTASWMSGYLIVQLGPRALLYFNFCAACGLCGVVVLAQVIGSRRGDRHKVEKLSKMTDRPSEENDTKECY